MLTKKEKFIILVDNEPLKKSDAIVLLEGDGYNRIERIVSLYKQNFAKRIIVTGGITNQNYGSFHGKKLVTRLIQKGITQKNITLDEISQNTRDQAVEIMKMVRKNKWKKIILVGSNFHQYRAFLTFLKAMEEARIKIQIINAPAQLPWFTKNPWGKRIDILEEEFKKIVKYTKSGHLATIKEALDYQQWKEKQK